MPALENLALEELRAHAVKTFRQGGGSRPDVLLIRFGNEEAVLKDYGRSDPWFRRLVGPLSARREARALEQLRGVRGVPRLLRRLGRVALLLEYVPGTSAREVPAGGFTPQFFEQFYRLVDRLHEAGVAHCDLRSTGNILVGADGAPHVVDFAAHFRRGRSWNPVSRWMYAKFCEADRTAVARLKKSHAPELLTGPEQQALARDRKTWLERGARLIGKSVRNLSRWLLTKKA
jgi:predicted Ser/Thr protein kinase